MTLAGYSGTPLVRKLGIVDGARVALSGAPAGFEELLAPLPDRVSFCRRLVGRVEMVILFSTSRRVLAGRFSRANGLIVPDGAIWAVWPKRSSGMSTDLSDGVVREIGLAERLVDNKVCAIDATWSALRFVVRRDDRPARV